MKRQRTAWIISLLLLSILAFKLPGALLAQRDDDYAWVRTLVEVHRQVVKNYVDPVEDEKLKLKAIQGMLSDLDPFTTYIPADRQEDFERMLDGSFNGVGITLDAHDGVIEVVTPIENSPALRAGVMAGDIILKVNGDSIEGMTLPDIVHKISGPRGTKVTLTVHHTSGEDAQLTMTREEIIVPTVKGFRRTPDDSWDYFVCQNPRIAYIRITQFNPDTFDELTKIFAGSGGKPGLLDQGLQGLILDLRFDPGGRLEQAIKVVNLFIKQGVIVSTKGRNRPEHVDMATGQGTLPYFPMVVLVNEHSASAAEIVAGSLKDNHRALIVGQRTYGKGSVQELIPLDDNSGELKLTVAYYYLPSGRLVHRRKDAKDWGVEPQIIVPMDDNQQRDLLMEQSRRDTIRRPLTRPSTQPAPLAQTAPATQPVVDPQLQQATTTMVGLVFLQNNNPAAAQQLDLPQAPTTEPMVEPTTEPDTQPAQ